ncbi:sodium:calcium antiporter [Microvirga sp. ACRRW]|uniref:sodium:calcium antiporter n=1 Tax=Microvirga sp. ACRRW TaxID=2918205 RepID=UPI001EF5E352|nr:sodium:calcium antiporter [Microvirga sp. ACRRW]MCG7393543.1 sodium:calcium antiporter [Microvirga sp. ACRRW]
MPLSNAQDYPIWINAGIFLAAAVMVWIAGTRLTHALDAITVKTGWGQAFVGMLLLGGITSLPEIANTITSSVTGNPALAVNNLLGSAAINVLLLAVADAFIGRDAVTSAVARPSTLMMATLCILVLITVAVAITVTDVSVMGIGIWSIVICALSIGFFALSVGYNERAPWTVKDVEDELEEEGEEASDKRSMRSLVITSAVTGAIIFVAGFALAQTGDALAEQTGIGTGMVGFALIGLSTSMPELSSIIAALRLKRYEMAFGQVLGTNFVNLSLILLGDAVFTGGPLINELSRFETVSALLGAILTGVFLIGLLERRNPTVMKMGWDSLAVMVLFAGGLVVLYAVE